jgi:hypothetical protein
MATPNDGYGKPREKNLRGIAAPAHTECGGLSQIPVSE